MTQAKPKGNITTDTQPTEKECRVLYTDRKEGHIIFRIDTDDQINKIKGGRLLVSFGGFYTYFVDTLLEDYKGYLNGNLLCIDGGQNLSIINMAQIVDFIIKNRYEIEQTLRGFSFDDIPPKELRY